MESGVIARNQIQPDIVLNRQHFIILLVIISSFIFFLLLTVPFLIILKKKLIWLNHFFKTLTKVVCNCIVTIK